MPSFSAPNSVKHHWGDWLSVCEPSSSSALWLSTSFLITSCLKQVHITYRMWGKLTHYWRGHLKQCGLRVGDMAPPKNSIKKWFQNNYTLPHPIWLFSFIWNSDTKTKTSPPALYLQFHSLLHVFFCGGWKSCLEVHYRHQVSLSRHVTTPNPL